MKKNIKFVLFSIITLLIIYTPNVFAADKILDRELIKIDGKFVHKLYDNTETGKTDYLSDSIAGKIILTIDGKEYIGFCVDFGINISVGDAENHKIEEYFGNVIGEESAKQLVKKLTEYVRFGYGSEGKNTNKYYLATQQLIWEAISDTGFYATDYYVKEAAGAVKKIRLKNFRWTTDEGKTTVDISSEINAIKNAINDYYKTPSFCSSQDKIEIEVGETAEYIDSNNVLSQFEVACDSGIECKIEDNKLRVTAINEAGSNKITFTKSDTNGTNGYIYKRSGGQGVITYSGTIEPVSCEFGIDSFKNEKTADTQIIYIVTIGLFCGVMAYITYYTKKSLDGLK